MDDSNSSMHRITSEDVLPLALKYAFTKKGKLGGIGMWTANGVDRSDAKHSNAMWQYRYSRSNNKSVINLCTTPTSDPSVSHQDRKRQVIPIQPVFVIRHGRPGS